MPNTENRTGEVKMYLYWRVQQDLDCLGESLCFHDPALIQSLRQWVRKNFTGLSMAQDHFEDQAAWFSRN
jgi:hypothetical protein